MEKHILERINRNKARELLKYSNIIRLLQINFKNGSFNTTNLFNHIIYNRLFRSNPTTQLLGNKLTHCYTLRTKKSNIWSKTSQTLENFESKKIYTILNIAPYKHMNAIAIHFKFKMVKVLIALKRKKKIKGYKKINFLSQLKHSLIIRDSKKRNKRIKSNIVKRLFKEERGDRQRTYARILWYKNIKNIVFTTKKKTIFDINIVKRSSNEISNTIKIKNFISNANLNRVSACFVYSVSILFNKTKNFEKYNIIHQQIVHELQKVNIKQKYTLYFSIIFNSLKHLRSWKTLYLSQTQLKTYYKDLSKLDTVEKTLRKRAIHLYLKKNKNNTSNSFFINEKMLYHKYMPALYILAEQINYIPLLEILKKDVNLVNYNIFWKNKIFCVKMEDLSEIQPAGLFLLYLCDSLRNYNYLILHCDYPKLFDITKVRDSKNLFSLKKFKK